MWGGQPPYSPHLDPPLILLGYYLYCHDHYNTDLDNRAMDSISAVVPCCLMHRMQAAYFLFSSSSHNVCW